MRHLAIITFYSGLGKILHCLFWLSYRASFDLTELRGGKKLLVIKLCRLLQYYNRIQFREVINRYSGINALSLHILQYNINTLKIFLKL